MVIALGESDTLPALVVGLDLATVCVRVRALVCMCVCLAVPLAVALYLGDRSVSVDTKLAFSTQAYLKDR